MEIESKREVKSSRGAEEEECPGCVPDHLWSLTDELSMSRPHAVDTGQAWRVGRM